MPVMIVLATQTTPPLMDTLKKRSEFLAVAKGGRVNRRAFVLQGLKRSSDDEPRFGYTVTKKTGNAVVRNRIKRRLRAAVSALGAEDIPAHADFVIVGREPALTFPFQNLVSDLKSALRQVLMPGASYRRKKPRQPRQSEPAEVVPRRKQG